jgi:hypothetical protein
MGMQRMSTCATLGQASPLMHTQAHALLMKHLKSPTGLCSRVPMNTPRTWQGLQFSPQLTPVHIVAFIDAMIQAPSCVY